MEELLNAYGVEAAISLGAALFTAVGIRFKEWIRGQVDEDAPLLRQFLAYLLAYGVTFAAVRNLDGAWRHVIIVLAFVMAFAVTINGPAPLVSRSYLNSFAIALASGLALWALYAAMLYFYGIDLLAPRRP